MNDAGRQIQAQIRAAKTDPVKMPDMKKKLIQFLAKAPWVLRQITKATAYVGTGVTVLLDKAVVTVGDQTIDFFSAENTAALAALAVTVTAGAIEAGMSYAAAKVAAMDQAETAGAK